MSMQKLIEGAIAGSPYARKLGVVCESIETDRVRMRLPYADDVTTMGDLVHGGAIASLVDIAATAAAWSTPELGPGARGTTIGFSLSFLAGGRGRDLIASASAIQRGRSICVCEVDVRDADGARVAQAIVTYKLSTTKVPSAKPRPEASAAAEVTGFSSAAKPAPSTA
jgi:uncharacterized protein (TIGR00369 family)